MNEIKFNQLKVGDIVEWLYSEETWVKCEIKKRKLPPSYQKWYWFTKYGLVASPIELVGWYYIDETDEFRKVSKK